VTAIRFYTDFPFSDFAGLSEFASLAESCGYSGVFATENRHDAFLPIAAAARKGRNITMGTAVITALTRSPFLIAQTAWDLQYNTDGKFILGIGCQTDEQLKYRFGVSADDKSGRLKEVILCVRELWSSWQRDEEPSFVGRYYSVVSCNEGFRPSTQISKAPLIYVLCTTAGELEVAIDLADGIFTHPLWCSRYIDGVVVPTMNSRHRKVDIIASPIVVCGSDRATRRDFREVIKARLTRYFLLTTYDDVFEHCSLVEYIRDFRERVARNEDPWLSEAAISLYKYFVCDSALDELASRLKLKMCKAVGGIFPSILSNLDHILPESIVRELNRDG
jgi:alkanesulfonate monooxygenase SsuD/methylene tetrahydromethanopterin reductase-like flavin-dependent oxidoreductase (luciferase family)